MLKHSEERLTLFQSAHPEEEARPLLPLSPYFPPSAAAALSKSFCNHSRCIRSHYLVLDVPFMYGILMPLPLLGIWCNTCWTRSHVCFELADFTA